MHLSPHDCHRLATRAQEALDGRVKRAVHCRVRLPVVTEWAGNSRVVVLLAMVTFLWWYAWTSAGFG